MLAFVAAAAAAVVHVGEPQLFFFNRSKEVDKVCIQEANLRVHNKCARVINFKSVNN